MHTTIEIHDDVYKIVTKPIKKGTLVTVYRRGRRIDRFNVDITPVEFHTQLRTEEHWVKRTSSRLEKYNESKEASRRKHKTDRVQELPGPTRSSNNTRPQRSGKGRDTN